MSQTQLSKIQVLLVKIEATEGSDASPAVTDAIQLLEPAILTPGAENINANPDKVTGFVDEAAPNPPGAKWWEVSGRCRLRGTAAAYTATTVHPEIDQVIRAAGFSQTIVTTGGSESYAYDSVSASTVTATVHGFQALETGVWVKHVLLAARTSSLVLRFPAGAPGEAAFTLRGLYANPTDTSPSTPTYQTSVGPNFGGTAAFGLASFTTGVVREATIGIENTLAPRLGGNAADGLAGWVITNRRVTWSVQLEAMRVADYSPHTKWAAGTTEALAIQHPNDSGTQYNRLDVTCDEATILEPPTYVDVDGVRHTTVSGIASPMGTNRCKIFYD